MVHLGIFLTIFGAAFAMSPWTESQYALPKLLVLSLASFLMWAGILKRSIQGKQKFHWTPFIFPSFFFVGVVSFCTIFSLDWGLSIFGHYQSYTDSLLTICALMCVAHGVAFSKDYVSDKFILTCLMWVALLSPIYAFAQYAGFDFPRLFSRSFVTAEGVLMPSAGFGHPVYFGSAIALLFPLSLWLLFKGKPYGVFNFLTCILLTAAAIMTIKRGVWIGIVSGSLAYVLLSGLVKLTPRRGFLLLAVFCVGLIFYLPKFHKSQSDVARMESWKIAVSTFKDNMVVGTGPDTFSISSRQRKTFITVMANTSSRLVHFHAHNDFLQVASTMGFLGITAYLLLLCGIIFMLINAIKVKAPSIYFALAGGLIGVFAIAKFNPISMGTLMLCSVVVGFLMRLEFMTKIRFNPWPIQYSIFMLILTLPAAYLIPRTIAGDYYRVESFKNRSVDPLISAQLIMKAAKWAPWVFEIRRDEAQALLFLPMRATREVGLKIAEQAVKIGKSCIEYHPHNAEAQALYAYTLLARQHWGGPQVPEEAMGHLDRAQEMAPMFAPLMMRRARIASIFNDRRREISASGNAKVIRSFATGGL